MKKKILVFLTALALLVSLIVPSFTALAADDTQNSAAVTVVTAEAEANTKKEKKSPVKGIIISLVIGLIIGAIVIGSVKGKYKPVHKKTNATNYLVSGSYQLTGYYDNFIRADTSKREINTNN